MKGTGNPKNPKECEWIPQHFCVRNSFLLFRCFFFFVFLFYRCGAAFCCYCFAAASAGSLLSVSLTLTRLRPVTTTKAQQHPALKQRIFKGMGVSTGGAGEKGAESEYNVFTLCVSVCLPLLPLFYILSFEWDLANPQWTEWSATKTKP